MSSARERVDAQPLWHGEPAVSIEFAHELADKLDYTRRQLIEARAAMYRIGVEVDLVMAFTPPTGETGNGRGP